MYKLKLSANNTEYKAKGKTMLEALDDFSLYFTDIKTKGVLTIEKDGNKHERNLMLVHLRRLFVNSLIKKNFSRQIEEYFKLKHGQKTKN